MQVDVACRVEANRSYFRTPLTKHGASLLHAIFVPSPHALTLLRGHVVAGCQDGKGKGREKIEHT